MSSTDVTVDHSEPDYAMSKGEKTSYPWYIPNIDKYLVPETRELLEHYSHVPPSEQSKHVHEIRDQAWAIRSYPCTGLGIWLRPVISRSPVYRSILQRLKAGGILIDVGCFLGHDLRKLTFDGAPSDNLYGIDIVSHWDVGFALFRDRDRFSAKFIEADLFAASQHPKLKPLLGHVDVISLMAVLHQWSWDDQVTAAKQIFKLSKPGSLIVGYQIGHRDGINFTPPKGTVSAWRHNPESFVRLWNQLGAETGSRWETQAWARSFDDMGWSAEDSSFLGENTIVIEFVVTRLM